MPVVRLGFGIRLQPFLQAAIRADLIRRKAGTLFFQLGLKLGIDPEDFSGLSSVPEQLAQLLHVDGRAHAHMGFDSIREFE